MCFAVYVAKLKLSFDSPELKNDYRQRFCVVALSQLRDLVNTYKLLWK